MDTLVASAGLLAAVNFSLKKQPPTKEESEEEVEPTILLRIWRYPQAESIIFCLNQSVNDVFDFYARMKKIAHKEDYELVSNGYVLNRSTKLRNLSLQNGSILDFLDGIHDQPTSPCNRRCRISVSNSNGASLSLLVDLTDLVEKVYQRCCLEWDWDPLSLVLTYGGKILQRKESLSWYGIVRGSRLTAAGRVLGG